VAARFSILRNSSPISGAATGSTHELCRAPPSLSRCFEVSSPRSVALVKVDWALPNGRSVLSRMCYTLLLESSKGWLFAFINCETYYREASAVVRTELVSFRMSTAYETENLRYWYNMDGSHNSEVEASDIAKIEKNFLALCLSSFVLVLLLVGQRRRHWRKHRHISPSTAAMLDFCELVES